MDFARTKRRARQRLVDPIFGEMVDFGWLWGDERNDVQAWCEANVGRHGDDFQMRNDRVSFARSEDADLCYLAFA